MKTELPKTINELINSNAFQCFIENKLGNDLFLSDPDRADRIHEAAEDGADGSTHAEHIEDWLECLEQIRQDAMREAFRADTDAEGDAMEAEVEAWHDAIEAEVAKCEAWHKANGTLHEQCG